MPYIDTERLKHILNQSKYYGTKAGNAFADMIAECDSADVQKVKHGKWLSTENDAKKCSCCGVFVYVLVYANYCPNCGAEMDGEEKEEM